MWGLIQRTSKDTGIQGNACVCKVQYLIRRRFPGPFNSYVLTGRGFMPIPWQGVQVPHTLHVTGGGFHVPHILTGRGFPPPYPNWKEILGFPTGVRFQVPITRKWFSCSSIPGSPIP